MKVLYTGGRRSLFNPPSHSQNVENGSRAIMEALDRTDTLDVRPVTPGEDLSGYDAVIVEVSTPLVWGARYSLGAYWALGSHPNAFTFYSHWDIKGVWSGNRNQAGRGVFGGPVRRAGLAEAAEHEDLLQAVVSALGADGGSWPSMATAFPWGDHSLLTLRTDLKPFDVVFDPTPFTHGPNPYGGGEARRERTWMMGSAESHKTWIKKQGLTWPTELYGLKKHGRPWSTLDGLVKRYGEVYGALAPPYYHVGSGWWRPRFIHAAQRGCITRCDPRDTPPDYPEAFGIELCSDEVLAFVAAEQSRSFWKHTMTENEMIETIRQPLERGAQ